MVSAGIIKAGNSYSTGPPATDAFGTGSLTIATGAVLDLNGQTINNTTTISGTGISSTGAITNSNATAATISGNITLAADSSIGGSNNVTLSGVISGAYNLTKVGSSTYTLSGTNTYSGNTTISAGTIKLTGSVNALTDLSIASGATLDLQSTQTFATLDLDGTITRTAGSSALTITGASDLGGSVTTSGTQTYSGAVVLSNDVTLTTTDSNITFGSTIDSDDASTKRDLTLTLGSGSASVTGIVGTTSLDILTLNSSSSFTAAVTATSIVNAANKTATFSDDVTAAVTNSGGLLFNHTGSGATVRYYLYCRWS